MAGESSWSASVRHRRRGLDDWKGRFEKADLLELAEAGYVRLESRQQATFEGRLTKRARDAYAAVKRESGVEEEITSGDENLDHVAELLTNRVVGECGNRQAKRLNDLKADMAKRGILGSGIEEQGKIKIATAFIDEYAEEILQELLALVRKAHGQLERGDADWIRRRIEGDLNLLKTGQAGCALPAGGQARCAAGVPARSGAVSPRTARGTARR